MLMHAIWKIILVLATIIGAFGGFPQPPKLFGWFTKFQVVQWGLVAVLAYQGGAGENILLSVVATIVVFAVYKALRMFEAKEYIVIE